MSNETGPGGPAGAPRVSYWTLGCRLNQHDTAAMRARLAAAGYGETRDSDEPDVVVVNTCTVTARADQEARQLIRRLSREHPRARLVVTGCYAQRAPDEVAALPGVGLVLGTAERDRIADELERSGVAVAPGRARRDFVQAAPLSFGRTRALLKIQDGCDAFCAYCVVPYVRGRSRSLPIASALEQARRLLDAGFRELVVTGADLGAYGRDLPGGRGGEPLPRLVEALLSLSDTHRVRLSSIEPNKVDPGLVALLGSEPRLCRHLHLPLQSGSAAVLRAMRRPYTPGRYAELVERVAARGTVAIGADVIVGFPGEEERDFEETLALIERLPIAYLHVFRYSQRPGTRASDAPAARAVPVAISRERAARLRALGDTKRLAFYRSLVGCGLDAILERPDRSGVAHAMTDVYAPVRLDGAAGTRSRFRVRVESLTDGVLAGALEGASANARGG